MCDLYPSPTAPILQHLLSYEDYEDHDFESDYYTTASGLTITQLDSVPPEHSIRPSAFVHGLRGESSKIHDELTFGYEHHEGKISLIFNRVPDFNLLLSIFYMIHTRLRYFELEGIDEVTFNAGQDDELVYQNVSWMLQQNISIIPTILDFVQTHHRSMYLND